MIYMKAAITPSWHGNESWDSKSAEEKKRGKVLLLTSSVSPTVNFHNVAASRWGSADCFTDVRLYSVYSICGNPWQCKPGEYRASQRDGAPDTRRLTKASVNAFLLLLPPHSDWLLKSLANLLQVGLKHRRMISRSGSRSCVCLDKVLPTAEEED